MEAKKMRELWLITAAALTLCSHLSFAQEGRPKNSKYVVAPAENTLVTVASQPTAPIVIEDAKLLLNIETSWAFKFSYQLRNRATKPIRSYTIYYWTSDGSGGTLLSPPLNRENHLKPGDKVLQSDESDGRV